MLVRLLIALLMLAGPLPVRFCTCSASSDRSVQACEPTQEAQPTKRTCGCKHREHSEPDVAPDQHDADRAAGTCTPLTQHEPDCPAVRPQLTVTTISAPATTVAEFDFTPSAPVRIEALLVDTPAHSRIEPVPDRNSPPIYLLNLTLRN